VSDAVDRTFAQRTFGALGHRWFRWLFVGAFLSTAGSWLHTVVLQYLVARDYDEFLSGLISFLNFIPALFFGLVGGVIADRFPRRRLLIVTQWIELSLAAAMAAAYFFGFAHYWVVASITFGMGLALAVNGPTFFAFYPSLVPPEDLPSAVSLSSMQFNIGRVIGPGAGAFILTAVGAAGAFGLNAISFVALLIPLYAMKDHDEPPGTATGGESSWRVLADGFRYVRHKPWLKTLLLNRIVQAFFAAQVVTLLAPFAVKDLGYEASGTGVLFSVFGVGGLLGALFAAAIVPRLRREILVPGIVVGIGVTQIALGYAHSTPMVLAAVFASGVVYIGGGQTAFQTIMQMGVRDDMRGRVTSMLFTIFVGLFPIGALIWGAVATKTGVAFTFVLGGIVMLLYGLVVFVRPKWLREDRVET